LLSVWTVTDNSDNPIDTGSLRYAIDNEPSGTTIRFAPNVMNIILASTLDINTSLDVEGPGPNVLTVTGDNVPGDPVFDVPGDTNTTVILAGLTVANGNFGGIQNFSLGALTMSNCTVSGCRSPGDGGGIDSLGPLTMTDCTVVGNSAPSGFGAGIDCGSPLIMNDCTVAGNAGLSGGGIFDFGPVTMTNCTVTGNSAATIGGGILPAKGTLTMTDCTVTGNSAGANGGAIESTSALAGTAPTLILTNSTFDNNSAGGNGGGIDTEGTLTMTNCAVTGNSSAGNGGGIRNATTLRLTNSTVSNNSARHIGGGIDNKGMATIANCALSGNEATDGGGVDNEANATASVTGCTFANNGASDGGGGINNGGTANVTNCTLSGNLAVSVASGFNFSGLGGGIANQLFATVTVTNCTLAGNGAGSTGGGVWNAGVLTLNNTIVAASLFSDDAAQLGTLTGSHNLVDDGSDRLPDTIVANPLLGPLATNEGSTQTMALLPGSPAIDAGSNALILGGITTDQRGVARILNGTVDIGAFESRGFTIAITSGSAQSTSVASSFLNPLVVMVSSPYGDPVQGGVVTFTAPASGAGAMLTGGTGSAPAAIDPTGQAAVAAAADTIAGSYAVTASARGASFSAGFSLSNLPGMAVSIKAMAGTPQSTTVGYAFATPLQVMVTDAYGNAVPGVTVTFAAPTYGPGSSFSGGVVVTDASGIAATTCTANTKAGSYAVTASARGVGSPETFSLTNTPDVASRLFITAPVTATLNTPSSFTVTALDQYGNIATGYRGTIAFSSSDLKATLPANYPFVASDNGVHPFQATLGAAGSQTLRVSDTVTASLTSSVTLIVSGKPPKALVTTQASPSGVASAASWQTARVRARHPVARQTVVDRHRLVTLHSHARPHSPHALHPSRIPPPLRQPTAETSARP
jgi:predicted outer membrane repeat protein